MFRLCTSLAASGLESERAAPAAETWLMSVEDEPSCRDAKDRKEAISAREKEKVGFLTLDPGTEALCGYASVLHAPRVQQEAGSAMTEWGMGL